MKVLLIVFLTLFVFQSLALSSSDLKTLDEDLEKASQSYQTCFNDIKPSGDQKSKLQGCLKAYVTTAFDHVCSEIVNIKLSEMSSEKKEHIVAKRDRQIVAVSNALAQMREESALQKELIPENIFVKNLASNLLELLPEYGFLLLPSGTVAGGMIGMGARMGGVTARSKKVMKIGAGVGAAGTTAFYMGGALLKSTRHPEREEYLYQVAGKKELCELKIN